MHIHKKGIGWLNNSIPFFLVFIIRITPSPFALSSYELLATSYQLLATRYQFPPGPATRDPASLSNC